MSPLCLSAGKMALIKIYGVNGVKDLKPLISEYVETRGNYSLLRRNRIPSLASLNVRNIFRFVLRTQAQVWMERRMFQEPVLLHQTERSWSNFRRPRQRSLVVAIRKYGTALNPRGSFHLRHRMIQSFLWLQLRRHLFPGKTQRQLGFITAHSFGRGYHTGRMIVKWAKSWVRDPTPTQVDISTDEDVVFAVRDFIREQGESKYTVLLTYHINHIIEIK
jgi:hypothetical protein